MNLGSCQQTLAAGARANLLLSGPDAVHGSDAQTAAARARAFATRIAGRYIAALVHAVGVEGLRQICLFLCHLAAAQVAALVDGSTAIRLERVARDLRRP